MIMLKNYTKGVTGNEEKKKDKKRASRNRT